MYSFLEQVTDYVMKEYPDKISECCIVLPNRRAGLFLKKHLAKKIQSPIWLPDIFSAEDFIIRLSGLEISDNISLLFELYDSYQTVHSQNTENFDSFIQWGHLLLADFNEIDSYLADASQLFRNLTNVKELENWSLHQETLTDFQKQYLDFWQSLGELYRHFSEKLLSKKQAYQGLSYRVTAETISHRLPEMQWHKIIFCGFNALNKAEETIIRYLVSGNKAELLWDTDEYYTGNPTQEAGKFLRNYIRSWYDKKPFLWKHRFLSSDAKNVHIIGVTQNMLQAKTAGAILAASVKGNETASHTGDNTAVVLADESLLFPVLHSIPEDFSAINVTMGFPLKNSPIAGLTECLFKLHENSKRFGRRGFYHKDVIRFFSHPYINRLFYQRSIPEVALRIIQSLQQQNKVFVSVGEMERYSLSAEAFFIVKPLFQPWTNAQETLDVLSYLITILKEHFYDKKKQPEVSGGSVEMEYLFEFSKIIKRLRTIILTTTNVENPGTLYNLLQQVMNTTTLPFYGEPLSGLQIMGMLETRTLDFENIILLSTNEGILPTGKQQNSFIPYDVKRVFGLPTYNDRDAIFAYHFYRLMQRAKNIYLLYNTETNTLGGGEKSRYITQLAHELKRINVNVAIHESIVNISHQSGDTGRLLVTKDEAILQKIREKGTTGFSPSLLNSYINCPLQFYFKLVAGIKEREDVEEYAGADVLGNVVHQALEELYRPFVSNKVTVDAVKSMKASVEILAKKYFEKELKNEEPLQGKNLLSFKVAVRFLHQFLDSEVEALKKVGTPLFIKNIEQELSYDITTASGTIKLKGKVDRIDQSGNAVRVLDYKTGLALTTELNVTVWEDLIREKKLNKSFQLLCYAYLYSHKCVDKSFPELQSGIISFRELSAGVKPVIADGSSIITTFALEKFEEQLIHLFNEIYNPSVSFCQTEDKDTCLYCDFKKICNR